MYSLQEWTIDRRGFVARNESHEEEEEEEEEGADCVVVGGESVASQPRAGGRGRDWD